MSFALDLQKFAERTGKKADDAVANVVFRISAEVDRRSPVGDASYWKSPPPKGYIGGRFRGNWQLGVGVIPAGETGLVDPSGASAQGRILASIPEKASGKVYFLFNNVPYAQEIETGHSRQAPQGVVGLTVIQFQRIVDEAVASLAA